MRRELIPHFHRPVQPPRALADDMFTPSGRMRPGLLMPRSVYRRLIFELLLCAPEHALPSREIRSTVERRLVSRFTAADLSLLDAGEPRWVSSMQWERKKMVMEGLLETTLSAGHGKWQLTREGVVEAQDDARC